MAVRQQSQLEGLSAGHYCPVKNSSLDACSISEAVQVGPSDGQAILRAAVEMASKTSRTQIMDESPVLQISPTTSQTTPYFKGADVRTAELNIDPAVQDLINDVVQTEDFSEFLGYFEKIAKQTGR